MAKTLASRKDSRDFGTMIGASSESSYWIVKVSATSNAFSAISLSANARTMRLTSERRALQHDVEHVVCNVQMG